MFELLTSKFEKRGLVYKGGPGVYLAEVFYNQDHSWPHECVRGSLAYTVISQLCDLTGADYLALRRDKHISPATGCSRRPAMDPEQAMIVTLLLQLERGPD